VTLDPDGAGGWHVRVGRRPDHIGFGDLHLRFYSPVAPVFRPGPLRQPTVASLKETGGTGGLAEVPDLEALPVRQSPPVVRQFA